MTARIVLPLVLALSVTSGCAGGHQPTAIGRPPTPGSPATTPPTTTADTSDPCATPNRVVTHRQPPGGTLTASDRAGGVGTFAGTWRVHGAQMVIRPDGTGTIDAAEGPYDETDVIRFVRYREPERLLATYTKVSYVDGTTGRPIPKPTDACSLADGSNVPGDQFLLRFAAPHLLIDSVIVTHIAPINLSGNPYWCGQGIAPRYQNRCGA